jgi:hypothetical protein
LQIGFIQLPAVWPKKTAAKNGHLMAPNWDENIWGFKGGMFVIELKTCGAHGFK